MQKIRIKLASAKAIWIVEWAAPLGSKFFFFCKFQQKRLHLSAKDSFSNPGVLVVNWLSIPFWTPKFQGCAPLASPLSPPLQSISVPKAWLALEGGHWAKKNCNLSQAQVIFQSLGYAYTPNHLCFNHGKLIHSYLWWVWKSKTLILNLFYTILNMLHIFHNFIWHFE